MSTAERVARFVREHATDAHATEAGTVRVLLRSTGPDGVHEEWETIPATFAAARDWLGY